MDTLFILVPDWPPSKSIETLLTFSDETIYYNLEEAMNLDRTRSGRRAAHCLIFARINSKVKALVMVRNFNKTLKKVF